MVSTAFLQEHGWTQPPGSRRVTYYRTPLSTGAPFAVIRRAPTTLQADTALLALASDTARHEVLPRLERALPQMELLHLALLSKIRDAACPELRGRDAHGERLRGHQHAVLVPLNLDRQHRGRVDHILVHAPMGLGVDAQSALRSIRSTYTKGADKPLFVTLAGLGRLRDFERIGGEVLRELAPSCSWTSCTPFVPPRHIKARRHTLEDQVQAELAARGLPPAVRIELLPRTTIVERGFHHFVRARRQRGRAPLVNRFFGLHLELQSAVRGPLTLGYAAHYGLGVFVADIS
jgi:CRISPR-associated protein Csb2